MYERFRLKPGDIVDDLKCIFESRVGIGKYKTIRYQMECTKCGRTKLMLPNTIRNHVGTTHTACGKGLKLKNKRFYSEWCAMRTRTTNSNYQHYSDYGGRGINSDEFKNFIDFYDSMYSSYVEACEELGEKNVSLDRIDFNGNYTKENCRWIHINKQQGNTRRTIKFEVIFPDGKVVKSTNLLEFSKKYNLNYSCLKSLLNGRMKEYKGFKLVRIY